MPASLPFALFLRLEFLNAGFFYMPRDKNFKSKARLRNKFLIAIFSLVLFFSLAEMALRIANFGGAKRYDLSSKLLFQMGSPLRAVDPCAFGPYEKDRLLFWKLLPNEKEEVNTKGYRGEVRDYTLPDGVCRIILLGDSCFYGISIRNKDTFAFLLEKKLNELKIKKFEVINAGVPGYSSFQGSRYLKSELVKYHPDTVLVGFGFNDLCDAVRYEDKLIDTLPDWVVSLDNSLSKTKFYIFSKQLFFRLQRRLRAKTRGLQGINFASHFLLESVFDLDDLIKIQSRLLAFPVRRVPPGDFADNLEEIIRLGKKYKFNVVLSTLPSVNGSFGYAQMLRLIAKKNNLKIVDLVSEFEKKTSGQQDMQSYFLDNNHYNEKGHRLVAEIIFDNLKSFLGIS